MLTRLEPLPQPLVETVRAAGRELVPAGWMRRQLDDRDRLRRELEARAPRPTRVIRTVPQNLAQPGQHNRESTSVS